MSRKLILTRVKPCGNTRNQRTHQKSTASLIETEAFKQWVEKN